MSRLAALTEQPFDVAIIGGGIHGVTLAWSASCRGLRVALVEQGDYGHATSANSLKVLHGGLRYLQYADLARVRESSRSRRRGFQLLPHLAHPKAFLVPTYGWGLRSKPLLWSALALNDVISGDRNRGVHPDWHIPRGRTLSHTAIASIFKGAHTEGLSGGALWHDGFIENTERFTLAFALSAEANGAVLANYVRAREILREGSRAAGMLVRDLESGEEGEVRAHTVVNTGGPWIGELTPVTADSANWAWTRGFSLVVRKRFFGDYGVGLEGATEHFDPDAVIHRGHRNLFFAPWRDGTLIGTAYKYFEGPPSECRLEPDEIEAFLEEIHAAYPPAELTLDDVTFAHLGVLPAPQKAKQGAVADPCKHTDIIDDGNGLIAIRGVKYTTAIEIADRLAARLAKRLGTPPTDKEPRALYGAERRVREADVDAFCRNADIEVSAEARRHLADEYGATFEAVLTLALDRKGWLEPVAPSSPVMKAEIVHAARHEHARGLGDVVLRRTHLGTFSFPGHETLATCAELMGGELEWDDARKKAEITDVVEHYRKLGLEHVL